MKDKMKNDRFGQDLEDLRADFMNGLEYELIRSKRRTLSIEINGDAKVIVRAPMRMPFNAIERFLMEKQDWIYASVDKAMKRKEENRQLPKLSVEQLRELAKEASKAIPEKVEYYANKMNVTYGRITIRNQKTRWGSCSAKGNLNFNCLLMLTPEEVQDYVIVHELCHRKEMNHSRKFWMEVEKVIPDYRQKRNWLKEYGGGIIGQMTT